MRVVSLLPSATETLAFVGGSRFLVGRSHECDYPPRVQDRPMLTAQATEFTSAAEVDRAVSAALAEGKSLYTLDEDLLRRLAPDVVLTQDLCEVCSIDLRAVERVCAEMDPRPEVVSLNPQSLEGVFDDILTIGRAVGLEREADEAMVMLRERLHRAQDHVNAYLEGPRVVFLEWTEPLFIGGHWTPQLIERAGAAHPLNPTQPLEGSGAGGGQGGPHRAAGKSIRVPAEAVAAVRPDAVIICPCGLDLEATRREAASLLEQDWFRELPATKAGRVAIVDGNQMFNRPGPRLVDAFAWLVGWLHDLPHLVPDDFPWAAMER
jgi:ABC-type Fe3+-hydroxamate transport system substrate-binding protein